MVLSVEPVFHLTERRYWYPARLNRWVEWEKCKEGQTPSMTDGQLYLLNIADKRVTPLTKDFNPSVQRAVWNKADGQIYFTAENRDCYSLYRMNPADGKIQQLEVSEDLVNSFSLAQNAPVMAYYGQSASNSDRLYTMNTKKIEINLCWKT